MPNSEVKRRSADGSVGSPHVRVGNRQASNKAEGPVERLGLLLLCYLLSVDKQSCHQGETRQSRFARNAARDREFICPVVMWMMRRRADTVVVKFFWTRRSDGRVMHRRATGRQGWPAFRTVRVIGSQVLNAIGYCYKS